jgi:hypothetical protein
MTISNSAGTLALVLFAWTTSAAVHADEADAKQRLAVLQARAEAMQLRAGEKAAPVKLRSEPLMRFTDPTRDFYDGALWAWVESGRPHALISVERYEGSWSYELIALRAESISLKTPLGQWKPKDLTFVEQTFPDLVPTEGSNGLRQQARQVSREFDMAQYVGSNGARSQLRLFPRPIYEYADPKAGLLHGAMFVYANGTNPEVLLLAEARATKQGKSWIYGCTPLSTAPLEAKLGEKVVWESPQLESADFRRPYVAFPLPLEQE